MTEPATKEPTTKEPTTTTPPTEKVTPKAPETKKPAQVKSVKAKKYGKKKIKVTWKKIKSVKGYQVQYSTNKKFKKAKTVTIKKAAATNKIITKLKSKKTYYVRVRAYTTKAGKKLYGTWSAKKSVKVK